MPFAVPTLRHLIRLSFLPALLLILPSPGYGQDQAPRRYFYDPTLTYGSAGMMSPLTIVVQNGLEMLAFHPEPELRAFPYRFGSQLMADELLHPFATIRAYGTADFINDEMFPYAPGRSNLSIVPNIFLHTLGGGMSFAWTEEYYRYHGVRHPVLAAAATMYLKNLMNELVETPPYTITRVDALADLYFWDIAGLVLFSQAPVKAFFSETVGLYNWGTMPVLSADTRLRNTNAYYAFRPVSGAGGVRPVVLAGLGFLAGFSVPVQKSITLTATGGVLSHAIVLGPEGSNEAPVLKTRPGAGLFLDRENSVLASLLIKADRAVTVRANVYPGLLPGRFRGLGLYAERGETVHAGLIWRVPGIGLGF